MSPLELLETIVPKSAGSRRHPHRRCLHRFLDPLFRAVDSASLVWRAENVGSWQVGAQTYSMPRFIFRRGGESPEFKLGIFAGVHGDEPAGVLALCDFIRALAAEPNRGRSYELHVYPLINPTGYEDGTRHSRSGKDLNREFWRHSAEPEVALIEREILQSNYHGFIALHSDDTSDGFYAFARGATLTEHLLKPALASAAKALPVNQSGIIDGFHAVEGIIQTAYDGILCAPPGTRPAPFEVILESPTEAPMHLQRAGFVLALAEILTHYRRLISYGADL